MFRNRLRDMLRNGLLADDFAALVPFDCEPPVPAVWLFEAVVDGAISLAFDAVPAGRAPCCCGLPLWCPTGCCPLPLTCDPLPEAEFACGATGAPRAADALEAPPLVADA